MIDLCLPTRSLRTFSVRFLRAGRASGASLERWVGGWKRGYNASCVGRGKIGVGPRSNQTGGGASGSSPCRSCGTQEKFRKGEVSDMDTQTSEQSIIEGVKKQLYIGGEWRDAAGGGTLAVEDPSTGEDLCQVADAQPEDSLAALDAAAEAQKGWAKHPPRER